MTYGKVLVIPKKKLKKMPFVEREFFEKFPFPFTLDVSETFRRFYHIPQLARRKGTFVRFGAGEEKFGVITKVVPKGVYVQEFREPTGKEEIGLVRVGKPFFASEKRFEEHLGEKGAVAIDLGGGLWGTTGSGVK